LTVFALGVAFFAAGRAAFLAGECADLVVGCRAVFFGAVFLGAGRRGLTLARFFAAGFRAFVLESDLRAGFLAMVILRNRESIALTWGRSGKPQIITFACPSRTVFSPMGHARRDG
jgi:hypothetical protein